MLKWGRSNSVSQLENSRKKITSWMDEVDYRLSWLEIKLRNWTTWANNEKKIENILKEHE